MDSVYYRITSCSNFYFLGESVTVICIEVYTEYKISKKDDIKCIKK